MRRFIALAAAALLAAGLLTGCGGGAAGSSIKRPQVESEELQFQAPAEGDPIAIFNTSAGEVRAVLYPDVAPMAVENFTRLAQEGYYNGTSFHRIVSGFVVQGGDASGSGTTGSTIWNNNPYPKEISDQLHHYSGALCAAFSPDESVSGLSQFYFVQSLPEKLDDSLRTQMDRIFAQRGAVPNVVFEVRECNAALQYVALKFGVSVLPQVPAMDTEKVSIIPISDQDKEFVRTVYLSWSRSRPMSPAAQRVRDYIVEHYSIPE